MRIKFRSLSGLIVTAYRSPSIRGKAMSKLNLNFFNKLSGLIAEHRSNVDFIVYCADDNTSSTTVSGREAEKYQTSVVENLSLTNLIGDQATLLKSNTQPDSIFGWFNPTKCRMTALVLPLGVTPKADHLPVQIRIDCVGIVEVHCRVGFEASLLLGPDQVYLIVKLDLKHRFCCVGIGYAY